MLLNKISVKRKIFFPKVVRVPPYVGKNHKKKFSSKKSEFLPEIMAGQE
jgi:hypothetical protein